jgi:hypothetical protein
MAYAFAGASSQNLTIASAPVTAKPVTIASFSRPTAGNTDVVIVQIGENSTNNRFVQYISSGRASGTQINDTVASNVNTSTTVANDTWRHCGSVFFTSVSGQLGAYVDGTKTTGTPPSRTPSGVDRMAIGSRTTNDLYLTGEMAEVAVWDVELTDDEIASLAKGFKPTRIRPQSLVFYAPLVRDLQDLKGALTITNNNTATVADHPRVY